MPNAHVDESLKFVKEFHNTTFNSETSGTLSTYMEKQPAITQHYSLFH